MKFTIHRGTKEIGGLCIEVTAGKTRLILDVGLPLVVCEEKATDRAKYREPRCRFPSEARHVPKVPGLFQEGPPVTAILLSHAHADHTGLLNYAKPDIPVYCTQGTSKMLMAGSMFAKQVKLEREREVIITPLKPKPIGDFLVTAYPVDHSAFDSVAYLIETEGKRLLFSGDLRLHGRNPGMVQYLVNAVRSRPVDVLLMEGTHFSGRREAGWTENELEAKLRERFCGLPGLVLANFSPMHVERMISFHHAAQQCNRLFVVDPYAAFVLHLVAGQGGAPKPVAKDGIRVYYNHHFKRTWRSHNQGKVHEMFLHNQIQMPAILAQPRNYTMVCRPSMVDLDFHGSLPPQSTWIYSYWKGYLDRPNSPYPNVKARLKKTSGDFWVCHTSGHIFAEDIERLVKCLNPKAVVPVHTTGREEFTKRFANTLLVEDGQTVSI